MDQRILRLALRLIVCPATRRAGRREGDGKLRRWAERKRTDLILTSHHFFLSHLAAAAFRAISRRRSTERPTLLFLPPCRPLALVASSTIFLRTAEPTDTAVPQVGQGTVIRLEAITPFYMPRPLRHLSS